MNTRRWHADDGDLARLADGTDDPSSAASLETHLLRCAECRRRAGNARRPPPSSELRAGTRWPTRSTGPSRTRCCVRSAMATPGLLQAAWLAAVLLVWLVPLVAARPSATAACSRCWCWHRSRRSPRWPSPTATRSDPAGELALATPTAGLRLVAPARAAGRPSRAARRRRAARGRLLDRRLPMRLALGWLLPGLALAVTGGPGRHDPARSATSSSPRRLGRSGSSPSRGPPPRARARRRRRRPGRRPRASSRPRGRARGGRPHPRPPRRRRLPEDHMSTTDTATHTPRARC